MIPVFLAPVLSALAQNGLHALSQALLAKGTDAIEKQLGVKIPQTAAELTPEVLAKLKEKEMEHEEFLTNCQKELALGELEAQKVATQEVTKRWEADMLSDSYLSKNIRPLALAGTLGFVMLTALLSAADIKISPEYVAMFKELLSIMVGAYFVGRTVEKGIDLYQGWKETKGN